MISRWTRPESPLGVRRVTDDMGKLWWRRDLDLRWSPDGRMWLTWAQLMARVKWVEQRA